MRFLKSTSRFQKNFMYVLKANVLAQVIQLAAMPLLTRLFGPDSFAVLTLFTSIMSIALSFSTCRFDWLIPNANTREKAFDLAVLSFFSIVLMLIIGFVSYVLCNSVLRQWSGFDLIRPYLFLLPLSIATGAILQVFQGWFVYEADLKESSKARLVNAVSTTGSRLAWGVIGWGTPGLLWSIVIGNACAIVLQLRTIWSPWKILWKDFSINRARKTMKSFAAEAFLSSWVSLANAVSLSVTPILLAGYYFPKEVGWYALVNRMALAPLGLITSAVMQSFWAEAAKLVKTDRRQLQRLYIESSLKLCALAVPAAIACLCAPLYTGILFGAEWQQAGYVLMALTPMIIGQIIVSPLSHLIIHGKQKWQLVWDVARFVVTVMIIMVCAYLDMTISWTVFYVSLYSLAMYGILFVMNYHFLSKNILLDKEAPIVI